jgi:hypothetical protein
MKLALELGGGGMPAGQPKLEIKTNEYEKTTNP